MLKKASLLLGLLLVCVSMNAQTDVNPNNEGYLVDFDNTPILKTVKVINREGTPLRQEIASDSFVLETSSYGENLYVIEELDSCWGIKSRITRTMTENGKTIERTAWEKVFVSKRDATAFADIHLVPADLNIIASYYKINEAEIYDTDTELEGYFKIELIDKSVYDRQKMTAVSFLKSDTLAHKKVKGVLTLPCQKMTLKFVDNPNEDDNLRTYQYLGQIPVLNCYVVMGIYYESYDFQLIEKTSAKIISIYDAFPFIANDKKHIVSIYTNPYEETAEVTLCSLTNLKSKHTITASYKRWMPAGETKDMFWSTDGYFYLPVVHQSVYWNPDGGLNTNWQYLRIKPLQ